MVEIRPGHECTSRQPPAVGQELASSKFLIGACQHACACLQCFVVLQPCSAADTVLSEEDKALDLCVFSPKTKVRIEEEEGSWEFP